MRYDALATWAQEHAIAEFGGGRMTVYPFHATYPDVSALFHVRCDDHPDFGFCGERHDALAAAVEHERKSHP